MEHVSEVVLRLRPLWGALQPPRTPQQHPRRHGMLVADLACWLLGFLWLRTPPCLALSPLSLERALPVAGVLLGSISLGLNLAPPSLQWLLWPGTLMAYQWLAASKS